MRSRTLVFTVAALAPVLAACSGASRDSSNTPGVVQAEGPYRMSFTDAKGKKQEDRGTTLTVLRKINGEWKVLYDTNLGEIAPSGS